MIIEFFKTDPGSKAPTRANPSDAGLDIYARLNSRGVLIDVGASAVIPTGIKVGVPHGYMLQVMNRSSIAAKKGLIVGAHVIDSGYDGEIFINLHNVGYRMQKIHDGDKIAQIVMIPVVPFRPVESKEDTLYSDGITISNRGDGALGSTGT
jgi:dUTP pyrophosphatase